jgi:hypothetical protein
MDKFSLVTTCGVGNPINAAKYINYVMAQATQCTRGRGGNSGGEENHRYSFSRLLPNINRGDGK